MNRAEARGWQLAQVRVSPSELKRWHQAARAADLRLAQAMRRQMRLFVREQLGAAVE